MATDLDEPAFEKLADSTLRTLTDALSDMEDETLDADLESGVLTLRFEDGTRYVINSHRAARQIWMAADSSAWHFDWNGQRWQSTKGTDELFSLVEERVGKKLKRRITLSH